MRPHTHKQPQVKKELCRVLDDVDVDDVLLIIAEVIIERFCCLHHLCQLLFINFLLKPLVLKGKSLSEVTQFFVQYTKGGYAENSTYY